MLRISFMLIGIFILPNSEHKFIKLLRLSMLVLLLSSLYSIVVGELVSRRLFPIDDPNMIGMLFSATIVIDTIAYTMLMSSLYNLRKFIYSK